MATEGYKFPQQKQHSQPGKEHVMNPRPQPFNPEYKPSNKLQGMVTLVTGGDSGIGRAVCIYFAKEGATVAFTYVKGHEEKDMDETLQMLKEAKTPDARVPMAMAADIGYEENCKKVVEEVVKEYVQIDILVNNAAEQHFTNSVEEITEFRLERGSSIINSTSVTAYTGAPTLLDYSTTKGAIVALTRSLALHLVEKWTPLQPASLPTEMIKNFGSEAPMGRAAQPHEIAPCYAFLASPQCLSYFTGQFLHPNGGKVIND